MARGPINASSRLSKLVSRTLLSVDSTNLELYEKKETTKDGADKETVLVQIAEPTLLLIGVDFLIP